MSTPDKYSDNPLCAEMERRCTDMLLVSQAVVTCVDVFEQACEPRAPKSEWFEKWPHWMLFIAASQQWVHEIDLHRMSSTVYKKECIGNYDNEGFGGDWALASIAKCYPVGKDVPAPVGWKVVGE